MTQTILIVDDSRVARTLTKRLVSEVAPTAQFKEAQSGEEAMTVADGEALSAILMDMNMPGIDGLSAAQRILEKRPGQKIALVTANIQDAVKERARSLGIAFIGKPAQKAEVEAFLKS